MIRITDIIVDSFQEYEGHISLVLFTAGCNFSCPRCYNLKQAFSDKSLGDPKQIIEKTLTPLHDAVVFLGGEPTIWGEELIDIIQFIKDKNLLVKVFSNGSKPDIVEKLNEKKLVDMYSIDFKALEHVQNTIGIEINDNLYLTNLKLSIDNILNHGISLEIRTTLWDNIHNRNNLIEHIKLHYPNIDHILQQDFLKVNRDLC